MSSSSSLWGKVFSPSTIARALTSFDRATGWLVILCWVAAFALLVMADIAVHKAASVKDEGSGTTAAETDIRVVSAALSPDEIQSVYNRLQRAYATLKISLDDNQRIEIKSDDGGAFRQWVAALAAVEILAPQFHWRFDALCVGQCGERSLMSAVISGEKKDFSLSQ